MTSARPKMVEANFREAFEGLKIGRPKVLPAGAQVSQNNVAKEAGCDPSALRKFRYPDLVTDIQSYVAEHREERPDSERQKHLKQHKRNRTACETIADTKKQRGAMAGLRVKGKRPDCDFDEKVDLCRGPNQ
jgi:hypothetical protein